MNIIVDTDIIFSSLLKKDSRHRLTIVNAKEHKFFSINRCFVEIFQFKESILKSTKLTSEELNEYLKQVFANIEFLNENKIQNDFLVKSRKICESKNLKHFYLTALALQLNGNLWTNFKPFKQGLYQNNFTSFFKLEFLEEKVEEEQLEEVAIKIE